MLSKKEILLRLPSLIDVLSLSEIFSILFYFVSSLKDLTSDLLLALFESILLLLLSDNCSTSLKTSLCLIIECVCQSKDHLLLNKEELFLPSSSFVSIFSQCLHKSNMSTKVDQVRIYT